jgi:ATP-binding cassette, subfamily B, bacterial
MRPRSVIRGRQRWDIGVVLGSPGVAELLEAKLRESPGVGVIRANPVTGRLLVHHDTALSGEIVGQLIRESVALAIRQARTRSRSSRLEPRVTPTQVRRRHYTNPSFTVAGSAALAFLLGKLLRSSPVVRVGVVVSATVVVVRRSWRRSSRSQHASRASLRSTRHPIFYIVGSHKRKLYLASLCSVLAQVLDTTIYVFFAWFFWVLINGGSPALAYLGLVSASSQLWFLAGATVFVSAVIAALSFGAGVLWRDLAQSVQHEWRTEMYAHVQRVGLRHLEGERTTRIASALTEDINQLGRFFAGSANDLIQICTSFFVFIPLFLFFAPGIAWIVLLPVPIIAWLSFSHQEHVVPDYAVSSEQGSLLNSQLINNLEASATVKSFTAEEYEIDRVRRLSDAYRQGNHRADTRTMRYSQTVRLCAMTSLAGLFLSGGLDVLTGTLSFNIYNALVGVPFLLLGRLPALGDAVEQYHRMIAALRRVLDLHNLPVESDTTGRELDVAKVRGELVLDGVTFAYPGRQPVLHNLSLRIAATKTTGIVGVTGAGKTTIAKLLLRLEDVASGRVLLDGHDIRELRLHDLRKAIGFVGQDAFLFDGTVRDNIRYGSFDADPERVESAARLAEADGFVHALPFRYDTMVGERGATLSGGQKQRVSLARAIVKNAPIVILDEATSAVDNETEAAIQRALKDFARDRTLVVIAHRLSTIRHADWIYVLGQGGVVVEGGTHHELLEHEGVYASLWRLQVGEASA